MIYVTSLSLIHIWRCRRYSLCRSRWSPYVYDMLYTLFHLMAITAFALAYHWVLLCILWRQVGVSSHTEPDWDFMIIFPSMHVLMIVNADIHLACILITLRPQLEEILWSMYVAIGSLSNYCRLRSLLSLICPCMFPTSIAVFMLSIQLSCIVELVTYIIYCTVGINTGLHVIRSAVSS